MKKSNRFVQKRRGLSTIVGGIIFVMLMIAGFSSMVVALDYQSELLDNINTVAEKETKLVRERLSMGLSTQVTANTPPNKLYVTVANSGGEFAEIDWLYVVNLDDDIVVFDGEPDAGDKVIPPGEAINIAAGLSDILIETGKRHMVKAVSSYGTILRSTLTSTGTGDADCDTKFFSTNREIATGETVSLILVITNKGTDTLTNVQVTTPDFDPAAMLSSISLTQSGVDTLRAGESTIYMWEAEVLGALGQVAVVTSTVTGDSTAGGAVCSPSLDIKISRESDDLVVSESRITEVKVFVLVPGPIGETASSGGPWGVIVANPLDIDVNIRRVVMTFFVPTDSSQHKAMPTPNNPVGLSPTVDADWSIPSDNTLMWRGSSPYTITARSAEAFMAKAAGTNSNADIHGFSIDAVVFTEVGEFAAPVHSSNFGGSTTSVVSVYSSDVVDSRADADIEGTRLGMSSATQETFRIVLADMDSTTATQLNSGATLSITVPAGFSVDDITLSTGFTLSGSDSTASGDAIELLRDGSTLITGITTVDIGGVGDPNARTIEFLVTPPTTEDNRIYVMFAGVDGTVNTNNLSTAAIAEIPLQVVPPP
jgi:uncharacterized repeat protein (TIGR01451 family)